MNKKTNNNQVMNKALELLPWYAINKLSDEDLKFMKEAIATYPELQTLVQNEQSTISLVKEDPSILDYSALEAPEDRVERVLDLINSELPAQIQENIVEAKEEEKPSKPSWIEQLSGLLFPKNQQFGSFSYASVAFVILTAVVGVFSYQHFQKEEGVFYPASKKTTESKNTTNATVLLVGVNGKLDSPKLLELLSEVDAEISSVPDKAGMYKVTLGKKLNSDAVNALINKLRAEKELVWFAGKSNNK